MSIEILNLGNFKNNASDHGIDVAFPVLAFECEVSVPVEKEIDAYEEVILKMITIGLTKNSIQKTLNITQSLCGFIFSNLEMRGYIERITDNSYKVTSKAEDTLNGTEIANPETEAKFGYMFVNAIKQEPLWYFHEGDILNIPRSDAGLLEWKLTTGRNEVKTFETCDIPNWRIEKSFTTFCKITGILEKKEKGEISVEEAVDLFAGIESDLIEAEYSQNDDGSKQESINNSLNKSIITTGKSRVRKLKREPQKMYLQMRIIIDPSVPGGFLVDSPFEFDRYDNDLFLRQIKWMLNPAHNVYVGENKFSEFLNNEVNKLLPAGIGKKQIDSGVFIRNKLPVLCMEEDRYKNIYDDTCMIIDLMQQDNLNLLAKEHIVSSYNSKLIEPLMNRLFLTVPKDDRENVSKLAYTDFISKHISQEDIVERFAKVIKVDRSVLPSVKIIFSAIKKLNYTNGNSIYEKLLNLIVIQYYSSSTQIKHFFKVDGIAEYIKTIEKLNNIRNLTSHDPSKNREFNDSDYNYYIGHVFDVANRLLEALNFKGDE